MENGKKLKKNVWKIVKNVLVFNIRSNFSSFTKSLE